MRGEGRTGGPGASIGPRRLMAQQVARHACATSRELVSWLGAVQAQDYAAAKWAMGIRLAAPEATDVGVERAIAEGEVIRMHALRSTWQLVAPEDAQWILALVGPRVIARSATRYRQLGLDAGTFRRSSAALERALRDGDAFTRDELAEALQRAGISTEGQRLAHLLAHAELEALICGGPRRGKQFTYVLLDERAPGRGAPLREEEALAELALRYFRSRGPATVADFTWWSGLAAADARLGLEAAKSSLAREVIDGEEYWHGEEVPAAGSEREAYLLPAFDEYLIGYRDRAAVLDPEKAKQVNANGGMLDPIVVVGGRVAGTWWRELARAEVTVAVDLFEPLTRRDRDLVAAAASRYGAFLGLEAQLVWGAGGRSRG